MSTLPTFKQWLAKYEHKNWFIPLLCNIDLGGDTAGKISDLFVFADTLQGHSYWYSIYFATEDFERTCNPELQEALKPYKLKYPEAFI